jgi:hypothetical protein
VPGKDPAPPTVPPAPVADRLRRALEVALAAPDPLGGDVAVSAEVTADGDVVGFTLTLPEAPSGSDRTLALMRVGALLQRITAAGWTEDLEVRTTLAPGTGEGRPAIQVRAREKDARN